MMIIRILDWLKNKKIFVITSVSFLIFVFSIYFFMNLLIPKTGNLKIEGDFNNLKLYDFSGKIEATGYSFSVNPGVIIRNMDEMKVKLMNKSFNKVYKSKIDEEGFINVGANDIEIIFDGNDKQVLDFMTEETTFKFYKKIDKGITNDINIDKINIYKKYDIKNKKIVSTYGLTLYKNNLIVETWTETPKLSIGSFPHNINVKIKSSTDTKEFNVAGLVVKPKIKGVNLVRFGINTNMFRLEKSLADLVPDINETILLKGKSKSFNVKTDLETKITLIRNKPEEYYLPLTNIDGKNINNENDIEIIAVCNESSGNVALSGELKELTFEGRNIITKNVFQWLENNYITIISIVITAFVTLIFTILIPYLVKYFLK